MVLLADVATELCCLAADPAQVRESDVGVDDGVVRGAGADFTGPPIPVAQSGFCVAWVSFSVL
jgi:hypothetical protein